VLASLNHTGRTISGAFSDIQKGAAVTRWRNDGRTVMSIPVTPGAELTSGVPVPLFKLPPEVDVVTPSPKGQKFYATPLR